MSLDFSWQEKTVKQEIAHCIFIQMDWYQAFPLRARHEFYANGSDTGLHWHEDFYALYVVRSGQGIHSINNHPYGITRGDIYILPPGSLHAYRNYHDLTIDAFYFQPHLFSNEELVALQLMPGFWNLLLPREALGPQMPDTPETSRGSFHDYRFHLSPERYQEIAAMVTEIFTESGSSAREAAILVRNQFFRMLVHVARWHAARVIPRTNTTESVGEVLATKQAMPHGVGLAYILQLCEERFSEPLTVPQLAALMFLSPGRFSEVFSQEVGVSPAAYIRRLRLERARTLLRTTSFSVTEIAYQVGFHDGAHLSRAFQAVFALTPTAYRATFP